MKNVQVYRNLHKNCWSVKHRGRVIMHAHQLKLSDVSFHVQPMGRQRVLTQMRKNVHAYVKGDFDCVIAPLDKSHRVTYNPYKAGYFYDADTEQELKQANFAYFDADGKVYYDNN